jgi:LysM repeat protein
LRRPDTFALITFSLTCLVLFGGCGQVITRVTPTPSTTPTPGVELTVAATARPTSTPAPYTPAPTATPTITPTPVIYRIASGDNLLKIAHKFGVSVAGIQDANGITDPRSLRVGQELLIPVEETGESGQGTPTSQPTPLPFAVQSLTFSNTPLGGLWCFGEVLNSTGAYLEQAGINIQLLDDQGKVVAEEQAYVGIDLLRPGAKAPFAVRFASPPQSFSSYQALPWKGVPGYVGSYYLDLEVRDIAGEGERYATYTVSGVVANVGPEDAVEITVTVTLYDALGRVIGMRRAVPDHNVILRGGQTTFSVELTPAGGPVSSFHAEAQGRRQPTPTP